MVWSFCGKCLIHQRIASWMCTVWETYFWCQVQSVTTEMLHLAFGTCCLFCLAHSVPAYILYWLLSEAFPNHTQLSGSAPFLCLLDLFRAFAELIYNDCWFTFSC